MHFDLTFVPQRGQISSIPVKMAMSIAMVMMVVLVAEVEVHCGAKDGVDGARMVLRVRGGATSVFSNNQAAQAGCSSVSLPLGNCTFGLVDS